MGLFAAQCQDFADQRCVVEFACIALSLVGGTGHIGAVELLAQVAARGKLHDRQVAGHLQGELVAFLAVCLCCGQRGLLDIVWNAIELFGRGVVSVGVGGIEGVLAELLAQLGLAFLDLRKTLLGGTGQLRATQHKVAHRVQVCLPLLCSQGSGVDGLVLGVQALVGTQAGPEGGDARHGLVVGGAQLGRVGHGVEVTDSAPGAAEAFGGHVEHLRDRDPVGREFGRRHRLQRGLGIGQQRVDRGRHLFGLDAVEQGEVGEVEERIGHVKDPGRA
ncbi:hypothetical protein D3C72_898330 [compost metagenome]